MNMRRAVVVLVAILAAFVPYSNATDFGTGADFLGHGGKFFAALSGGQEVPAVSTGARGKGLVQFRPSITAAGDGAAIRYAVGWEGLEGDVIQAHLHFGAKGTNGGVISFLCANTNASPQGLPGCPQRGIVRGTIGADQILGPDGQGIAPGEIGEVIRALREGLVYINVHTSSFPGGEIRGQIHRRFNLFDPHMDPTTIDIDHLLGGITDIQSR